MDVRAVDSHPRVGNPRSPERGIPRAGFASDTAGCADDQSVTNRLPVRVAGIVLAGFVLQLALPHLSTPAGLIVSCLPIAVAGWYAWRGFRRQARAERGRQRLGLLFGATSGAMLAVSYLLYTLDAILGTSTMFDTAADDIAITAAVVAVPAILVAVPAFPNRIARATYAIDVSTVAGAIFATAWQFVLAPAAAHLHATERGLLIATMLPEVVAAALALMLISRPAAGEYRSMRLLAGGMATFALAAIISVHNHTLDLPWYATGLGAVYLIAGLIIGLASQSAVTRGDATGGGGIAGSWSTLPYLPVTVALASVAVPYAHTGSLSPVLVWTLLGTSVLAMFRQFLNLLAVKDLVADLEEQGRRLDHQAHHDALTGLPNRAAFYHRARTAFAGTLPGEATALLLVDLDGFKTVNDTYGHAAGDSLLVQAGARIRAALREGDTVARLGGDEFAIIIPGLLDPATAMESGDRILGELSAPMTVAGVTMLVRGSVGVNVAAGPGHDVDQVLHEADLALYAAKAAGKGTVRRYEPTTAAAASRTDISPDEETPLTAEVPLA